MKSAIEKIFFGETDNQNVPVTEEWKRLSGKCLEIFDGFYESLNEEQKRQYDEIFDYQSGQESETVLQFYKEGFKLGLALAAEAFLNFTP